MHNAKQIFLAVTFVNVAMEKENLLVVIYGDTQKRKIALYGAEAVFIDTCRDECIKRLHGDKKRLASTVKEWEKYIDTWFDNYTE